MWPGSRDCGTAQGPGRRLLLRERRRAAQQRRREHAADVDVVLAVLVRREGQVVARRGALGAEVDARRRLVVVARARRFVALAGARRWRRGSVPVEGL